MHPESNLGAMSLNDDIDPAIATFRTTDFAEFDLGEKGELIKIRARITLRVRLSQPNGAPIVVARPSPGPRDMAARLPRAVLSLSICDETDHEFHSPRNSDAEWSEPLVSVRSIFFGAALSMKSASSVPATA